MNKIKIPYFWLILVKAYGLKREREKIRRRKRKKEGEKRRIQVWNTCLDICKETIVRMLVQNGPFDVGPLDHKILICTSLTNLPVLEIKAHKLWEYSVIRGGGGLIIFSVKWDLRLNLTEMGS